MIKKLEYLALGLGVIGPVCLLVLIGLHYNWPDVVHGLLGSVLLIFQLYYLTDYESKRKAVQLENELDKKEIIISKIKKDVGRADEILDVLGLTQEAYEKKRQQKQDEKFQEWSEWLEAAAKGKEENQPFKITSTSQPLIVDILQRLHEENPANKIAYIKEWLLSFPSETKKYKDTAKLEKISLQIYNWHMGIDPLPSYCAGFKKVNS